MVETIYLAVALIGFLHGLEPGHGWPIAMVYAARYPDATRRAFVSGSIISMAHLVSSVAVVAVYIILRTIFLFSIPYVNVLAGVGLAILGLKFLLERPKGTVEESHGHVHDFKIRGKHLHLHQHPDVGSHNHIHEHSEKFLSLAAIAGFALVLGFAHEEEFALLALVVAGVDPLIMMLLYAGAVTTALTGISVVSVKAYSKFEARLKKYEGLLPKVSGIVLLITAMTFLLGLR